MPVLELIPKAVTIEFESDPQWQKWAI
jgi:hypothetical protein